MKKRLRMISSKSSSSSSSLRSSQQNQNESTVKVLKLPPQQLEQPQIVKKVPKDKEDEYEETGRTTEMEQYFKQQAQIHAVITRKTNDNFNPKIQLDLKPKVLKKKDFIKHQVNESNNQSKNPEEAPKFEHVVSKQFEIQNIGRVLKKKATLKDFKQKMLEKQMEPPFSPPVPVTVKNFEMRKSQSSFPLAQAQEKLSSKVFEKRPNQVKKVMIKQSQKRIVRGLVSKQFQLLQNSKSQRDLPDISLFTPPQKETNIISPPNVNSAHLSTPQMPRDSFLQSQSHFKTHVNYARSSRNESISEFVSISGQKQIHQRATYSSFFAKQSQNTKKRNPKKLPSIFQTANKFFKKEQDQGVQVMIKE